IENWLADEAGGVLVTSFVRKLVQDLGRDLSQDTHLTEEQKKQVGVFTLHRLARRLTEMSHGTKSWPFRPYFKIIAWPCNTLARARETTGAWRPPTWCEARDGVAEVEILKRGVSSISSGEEVGEATSREAARVRGESRRSEARRNLTVPLRRGIGRRAHEPPAGDHGGDLPRVADIEPGVGVEQDEIRAHPGRDRAQRIGHAEEACGAGARARQRRDRCEAGANEEVEFVVDIC